MGLLYVLSTGGRSSLYGNSCSAQVTRWPGRIYKGSDTLTGAGSEKEGYQIDRQFVEDMIEAFREQKRLHRRFAFQIILQVRRLI